MRIIHRSLASARLRVWRARVRISALTLFVLAVGVAPGAAQSSDWGKWMVEVHGAVFGDPIDTDIDRNSRATLPAGAPFTTINGQPTRAVPSWVVGDGPVLFDEVRQSFANNYGVGLPAITALDGMLRDAAIGRSPDSAFGVRVGRDFGSWFGLEFSVDHGPSAASLSGDAAAALEATRASYKAAFEALLTTIPHTNGSVTATASSGTGGSSGNQTILTADAVFRVVRTSRVRAHVLVGGGLMRHDGSSFEAQFEGRYQFRFLGSFPIDEREQVTLHFSEENQVPIASFGVGSEVRVAGRSGVRVDLRVLASPHRTSTSVNATASRVTAASAVAVPSVTTPAIQFSSSANVPTTLSGAPISGLTTFSGERLDVRPQVTIGYFFRF